MGALFALIIAVGEAAAAEGLRQLTGFRLGRAALFIQQPPVDGGDNRHILRTLHAALQLQTGNAHLRQLLHIGGEVGILQAQGVAALAGTVHPVGQAAGLGTAAAIAASAPDEGGHFALAGIAHTQRAVQKGLNLPAAATADLSNFLPRKLTGQYHPLHPQVHRIVGAAQGMDAHLRAGVNGQIRCDLLRQRQHAPILHQNRVDAHAGRLAQQLRGFAQLTVGEQCIQREIDLDAAQMAVAHRLSKRFVGKIPGAAAGVECAEAHIHGIRAALHRGHHGLPRTGGREKLGHISAYSAP